MIVLPFYVLGLAIGGGVGALFLVIGWALGLAVSIRTWIQRGHLGYDFGDRALGQTLLKEPMLQPCGNGVSIFIRGIVHIVDGFCLLGYLWPLWDAKRQTFADKILTTVVVSGQPQQYDAKTMWLNALQVWKPVIKS